MNPDPLGPHRMFVTAQEAIDGFEGLLTAADVVAATLRSEDPDRVADFLGVDHVEVFDYVANWTDYVNSILSDLSPRMDMLLKRAGGKKEVPLYGEFYVPPEVEGSFDLAVALQIYKFARSENRHKVCKECGTLFVERETRGRKGPSRKTAVFCSDKCHDRYWSRVKRRRRSAAKNEAASAQDGGLTGKKGGGAE